MTPKTRSLLGIAMIAIGTLIIAFSKQIIFSGLTRVIGTETIVGKANVFYNTAGRQYITNPAAVIRWTCGVGFFGLLLCVFGYWFARIRFEFRQKNRL